VSVSSGFTFQVTVTTTPSDMFASLRHVPR
jgi:hypothetical protein